MFQRTFAIIFTLILSAILSPLEGAKKNAPPPAKKHEETSNQISKGEKNHYYVMPPKGWECINDKAQLPAKVELVLIGTGKGQFTPSINLATEKTELTIEAYIKLAKDYHESQGETLCRSLGTLETREGQAHLLQIDRKTGWGIVRFVQAALIKDGCAYVITATCLQEDFNEFASQFLKSIQSFAINSV